MRLSSMPLLLALCAVPACGDLDVVSVRTGLAIPIAMQGEWSGSWASSRSNASGSLTLRLQSYAGEAVVGVTIDNPCVVPRTYQFYVTGTTMELHADGEIVFAAVLGTDKTMVGSYQCEADSGVWQTAWVQDLAPIQNLSGVWEGTVTAASGDMPLLLVLEQGVRGGSLVIDGGLLLPGVLPTALGVTGTVRFRDGVFDFLLGTTSGVVPSIQMAGIGDSATLVVQDGLLQTQASPLLPFQHAVWQVTWKNR